MSTNGVIILHIQVYDLGNLSIGKVSVQQSAGTCTTYPQFMSIFSRINSEYIDYCTKKNNASPFLAFSKSQIQ